MLSRKTITIVTSPSSSTKSLPALGSCSSPTTKQPVQYRIEERRRTVYVTSDVSPSQWDPQSLNNIFTLAEEPENGQSETNEQPPVRRTRSLVETQVLIVEDNTNIPPPDARDSSATRSSPHRSSRRPGSKSAMTLRVPESAPPDSPRRSPRSSPTRSRILFYHKHDPHYGFTNFSAHPVIYKGKKYPTSEHLFQSFKVSSKIRPFHVASRS